MPFPLCRSLGLAAALGLALTAHPGGVAAADKPRLTLRVAPSSGTPSTVFVFQAVLTGGADTEDLYCLTTEWTWEEQADSSINETECPPYKAGETKIDRTFSEEQSFRGLGGHLVRVALRKGEREVAATATKVTVHRAP